MHMMLKTFLALTGVLSFTSGSVFLLAIVISVTSVLGTEGTPNNFLDMNSSVTIYRTFVVSVFSLFPTSYILGCQLCPLFACRLLNQCNDIETNSGPHDQYVRLSKLVYASR